MEKYSRDELETALEGAHVIVKQAREMIQERDIRIADLETAARNIVRLISAGHEHMRNGHVVRECVLPEEAIAQIVKALARNPS